MRNPSELAADYIALWNERDGARRAAILAEHWTVDATYIDPLARVAGRGEIAGLIAGRKRRRSRRVRPLLLELRS